jgi:hypothetical protein
MCVPPKELINLDTYVYLFITKEWIMIQFTKCHSWPVIIFCQDHHLILINSLNKPSHFKS